MALSKRTKRSLIIFGYVATLSWVLPAMSYNIYQMVEQHRIFACLKAIRYSDSPDKIIQASTFLESFGLEGLIYVIQELNQESWRDKRIQVANGLTRLLTGDEDRLAWSEKGELPKLVERWDEETAPEEITAVVEFHEEEIAGLMRKPGRELSPQERRLLLRFGVEFWLVNTWKMEDEQELLAQKAQMLEFYSFLGNKEIELTSDERVRAGDVLDTWLEAQQSAVESAGKSAESQQLFRLQRFLCGDAVRFEANDPEQMVEAVEAWHAAERKSLSPDARAALKGKLTDFLGGAGVPFSKDNTEKLCERIMAFKDDYIGYSLTVKFKKHLKDVALEWEKGGTQEIHLTQDEIVYLKELIRQREREYCCARLEMAKATADSVKGLVQRRFTTTVADVPKSHAAFRQLSKTWCAKNDEIVIIDLVELLKSPDFGVRVYMSNALVAIGPMAVRFLREALERPQVNPIIVVATGEKTKREREKELNAENRLARIESAWILGRIGTPKAISALKASLKDPDIGETVSAVLNAVAKKEEGGA